MNNLHLLNILTIFQVAAFIAICHILTSTEDASTVASYFTELSHMDEIESNEGYLEQFPYRKIGKMILSI